MKVRRRLGGYSALYEFIQFLQLSPQRLDLSPIVHSSNRCKDIVFLDHSE